MGAWRTDFVFDLGSDPGAAAAFAVAAPAWWRRFVPGLFVRVRGNRVNAFCKDLSAQPTWPVLRGRLVTDASGSRIQGTLSWALQECWPLLYALLACACLYGAAVAAADGAQGYALLFVGCAAGAIALAAWMRHGERGKRREHEKELREGLAAMLAGRSPKTHT